MNRRIIALRDSKILLVSQLREQARQMQELQLHLPADLHHPLPPLPTIMPAEIPEKRLQPSRAILDRYQFLAEQRYGQGRQQQPPSDRKYKKQNQIILISDVRVQNR